MNYTGLLSPARCYDTTEAFSRALRQPHCRTILPRYREIINFHFQKVNFLLIEA